MAEVNGVSNIEGWLKELYPEDPAKLIPESNYFLKLPFDPTGKDAVGAGYNMPILVTHENGVTVAGPDEDAFTLNKASSLVTKNASVLSNQFLIRSQASYQVLARAASSKASFGDILTQILESMTSSMSKRREAAYLLGRSPLAVATSGSTTTFVVSDATWRPALWYGLEGSAVQVLRPGGTAGTFTNVVADELTDEAGPTGNASNSRTATISSVTGSTKTITLSTMASAAASGDEIYFAGALQAASGDFEGVGGTAKAASYREMLGLDAAFSATSIHGITVASYSLIKPSSYAVGGALTASKIILAQLEAGAKNFEGEMDLLCSHEALAGLVNPMVDPTAVSSSNSKVGVNLTKEQGSRIVIGADGVSILGQSGKINVVAHKFVAPGTAYLLSKKSIKRVGAFDLSNKVPGIKGEKEEMFRELEDKAGVELRQYSNEALFFRRSGHIVKLTGIS